MAVETLIWANQTTGASQQLADFTGLSWTANAGAGSIVVNATLIGVAPNPALGIVGTDVYAGQGAVGINGNAQTWTNLGTPGTTYTDAQVTNTGELTVGGNFAGTAVNSAIILRNLEGGLTGGNSSGVGPTTTVSLKLDFTTNDPITYSDGVDSVKFWLSDIDNGAWQDQVKIFAYDTAGNLLPASTITFASIGTNVTAISTGMPAVISANSPTLNVAANAANGAVQVIVNDPTVAVGSVVVQYNNLSTGNQYVKISDLTMATMPPPPCFVSGTSILTENGEVAIEDLTEGDLVVTAGNGLVPVRWIGQRTVSATGAFAPIVITKGALGNTRDLMVSPAHRMVVSDPRVSALFSEDEVLVAAKSLVNGDMIYRKTGGMVTYFHILFDEHEVVFANGAPSESLYLGQSALGAFSEDTQNEVLSLFPELNGKLPAAGAPARPVLNASEAALLAS